VSGAVRRRGSDSRSEHSVDHKVNNTHTVDRYASSPRRRERLDRLFVGILGSPVACGWLAVRETLRKL
jgi:hypothetical protein